MLHAFYLGTCCYELRGKHQMMCQRAIKDFITLPHRYTFLLESFDYNRQWRFHIKDNNSNDPALCQRHHTTSFAFTEETTYCV